jgi:hypothetical protein
VQEIHITCPVASVPSWVNRLQRHVDLHEDVALIDFGCSRKRKRGYIVLCWAGQADLAVIASLQGEPTIEDVSVVSIPESVPAGASEGSASR